MSLKVVGGSGGGDPSVSCDTPTVPPIAHSDTSAVDKLVRRRLALSAAESFWTSPNAALCARCSCSARLGSARVNTLLNPTSV